MGFDVVTCVRNPLLSDPISSHPDCAVFTPDNRTYFIEAGNYENIVKYFTIGEGAGNWAGDRFIKIKETVKSPYPDDVILNCKAFGRKIICNTNAAASEIRIFAENNGFELIHCNQGYVGCSTVKLNDYAAITDDESVFNVLKSNGTDCIRISKGSVKLSGFDYGFIGGCCGLIDNKLYFNGSIELHRDCQQIKSFLNKHSIDYENLFDYKLTDIGGIISIV